MARLLCGLDGSGGWGLSGNVEVGFGVRGLGLCG